MKVKYYHLQFEKSFLKASFLLDEDCFKVWKLFIILSNFSIDSFFPILLFSLCFDLPIFILLIKLYKWFNLFFTY